MIKLYCECEELVKILEETSDCKIKNEISELIIQNYNIEDEMRGLYFKFIININYDKKRYDLYITYISCCGIHKYYENYSLLNSNDIKMCSIPNLYSIKLFNSWDFYIDEKLYKSLKLLFFESKNIEKLK